jgi:Spy/CpxP family protein refolding chaperone
MSKRVFLIAGMLVALSAASVAAQQPSAEGPQGPQPQGDRQKPPPPPDPLGDSIFPPDMIMQHQRELALTDDQKTFMRGEIQRTTTRFNELQWQLQDQMEALHETVKSNSINEQLALSQLDKVLESEREIKRLHMEMAIRIKNKLTADQQMKLQTIRQNMRPRGDGPDAGPGRGPGQGRPGGPGGLGPGGPGAPRLGGPGQGPGQGGPGPGRPGGPSIR